MSSPPTILYTLLDGTLGVDPVGRVVVLPGAILHLDCLFQKSFGQPHWIVFDLDGKTNSNGGGGLPLANRKHHTRAGTRKWKHHRPPLPTTESNQALNQEASALDKNKR